MSASIQSQVDRSDLFRWVLLAGAAFVAWKCWRGVRAMFWTAFGLGWVLFWSQGWRLFS